MGRLRADEEPLLNENPWVISDAVLWEIGFLERDGRIRSILATRQFDEALSRITTYAVDRALALGLRRFDFRSDPADEIIAATSLVHDIPLFTRDSRILGSKVVPLAVRD